MGMTCTSVALGVMAGGTSVVLGVMVGGTRVALAGGTGVALSVMVGGTGVVLGGTGVALGVTVPCVGDGRLVTVGGDDGVTIAVGELPPPASAVAVPDIFA